MAKGTETLKEARNIIEEMNLNIDRFNQGLKDSDGFTKKMTNNVAETLQGLHDSRKANKMNGKQLGAVADLGKEILDGNIDVAKSKRMQESLQAKLNKKMSAGQRRSIEEQIKLLKTRDEWDKVFLDTDACYAPVLSIEETHENEHMKQRNNFLKINNVIQPAPAPRFSSTKSSDPKQAPNIGEDNDEILKNLGYNDNDIINLKKESIIN